MDSNVIFNPYLMFAGNAEEALKFYQSIFGGNLSIMRFGDMPGDAGHPDAKDKVMHGSLEDGDVVLMGSDAMDASDATNRSGVAMSLNGFSGAEAKLRGYWDKLAEGGNITQPLVKAEWGDTFGMVTDKFGSLWMVNISTFATAEEAENARKVAP